MLLLNVRRKYFTNGLAWTKPEHRRMILPAMLLVLLANTDSREIVLTVLSDAFWQVSVFVAATLAVYHLVSNSILTSKKLARVKSLPAGQVIFASLLGAIPGCGGAIVVITQYVSGSMSFGSVVAVLTATMGDAAFLLLASEPATGLGVIAMSIVVGLISGLVVDRIHAPDFLRPTIDKKTTENCCTEATNSDSSAIPEAVKIQGKLWRWMIIPGAVIGLMTAAQYDFSALSPNAAFALQLSGAVFALLFITLWATTSEINNFETLVAEDKKQKGARIFQKVALDTNFVTSWVVLAFICFELIIYYTQFDLAHLFSFLPALAPFAGVLVGMIPGCGPQIITTSLYLSGSIPLSAQIGNAISNDGDALFPAIALSPKVAIWATAYSSIPALITAYTYFWLFE